MPRRGKRRPRTRTLWPTRAEVLDSRTVARVEALAVASAAAAESVDPGTCPTDAARVNPRTRTASSITRLMGPYTDTSGKRAVSLSRSGRCENAHAGAIAFADGLNHYGDSLGFFADGLLGDDPQAVKARLKERFRTLLERDFAHLLFAHGDPIVGHGKTALRDFATSPAGRPRGLRPDELRATTPAAKLDVLTAIGGD